MTWMTWPPAVLHPVHMSVNSSLLSVEGDCLLFMEHFDVNTTMYCLTRFFLLIPLSIFILYLGFQRWRQQRSFKTTSHCDMFTYHLAALELIWGFGAVLYLGGSYTGLLHVKIVGLHIASIIFDGESLMHVLTCVERYLAVVHPVTYRGLRSARGARIRNISAVCAWLLCFAWTCLQTLLGSLLPIPYFCSLAICFVIVSFCSLGVLWALIRPGPGDGGGDRQHVDQSKQRAFFTVMAIMGLLWLWFTGFIVTTAVSSSPLLGRTVRCVVLISGFWFNLPSTLILPLLYLHRTGKLPCCHHNRG